MDIFLCQKFFNKYVLVVFCSLDEEIQAECWSMWNFLNCDAFESLKYEISHVKSQNFHLNLTLGVVGMGLLQCQSCWIEWGFIFVYFVNNLPPLKLFIGQFVQIFILKANRTFNLHSTTIVNTIY